jgi:uncharacterized membrane protein YfcA
VPAPKSPSFFRRMFDAASDFTLVILMVAAVISLVFGFTLAKDTSVDWFEGLAILVSICVVILVTAGNDYQKDKQFRQLRDKQVRF